MKKLIFMLIILSSVKLFSQELLFEKYMDFTGCIIDNQKIDMIFLHDNNILITCKTTDISKNKEIYSCVKLTPDGEKIWQTDLIYPDKLIYSGTTEKINGNISVGFMMGKYGAYIYDYTPLIFNLDKDGNITRTLVDTVSEVTRLSEAPGVLLEKDDNYINISSFKKFLLVKKFDKNAKLLSEFYCDTISEEYNPEYAFNTDDGGTAVAGDFIKSNPQAVGHFLIYFDKDFQIKKLIIDTTAQILKEFLVAKKAPDGGLNFFYLNEPYDLTDSLKKAYTLKHFDINGNVTSEVSYKKAYKILGDSFFDLQDKGYLFFMDTIASAPYNYKMMMVRTDRSGNILWKKFFEGPDNVSDHFGAELYAGKGKFYICGKKNDSLYFAFLRDNTISSVIDSIEGEDMTQLITLYPNPAKEKAEITLDISKTCNVAIDLYGIRGRKIRSIFDEPMDRGSYHISFPVSSLPAGAYFIVINSGGKISTQKFIVK